MSSNSAMKVVGVQIRQRFFYLFWSKNLLIYSLEYVALSLLKVILKSKLLKQWKEFLLIQGTTLLNLSRIRSSMFV